LRAAHTVVCFKETGRWFFLIKLSLRIKHINTVTAATNVCWAQVAHQKPEQSRAEQSRAEQSRAEQSRAEQSRAEQSRAVIDVNL